MRKNRNTSLYGPISHNKNYHTYMWKEEFDKKFNWIDGEDFQGWIVDDKEKSVHLIDYDNDPNGLKAVKQFIEKTLQEQRDEIIKWSKLNKKDSEGFITSAGKEYCDGWNDLIEDLINHINTLK